MPEAKIMSVDGSETGTIALVGPLFESEPKQHVIHEYVKGFMRNQRQGTASTLNRSRMAGGGRKPFRQKGSGRARAGSNISPLWTGGAIAWGPTPKKHYRPISRSVKKRALRSAFSLRAIEGNIKVVDLPNVAEPKTKVVAEYLKKLGLYHQKTVLLFEGKNDNLVLASRNIKYFNVKRAELVNPFDLLWHQNILITEQGLNRIKEIFGNA
ncbi:MAG: 50S ribosomal protein L4 [candidate division Zixibacteria bacterium]